MNVPSFEFLLFAAVGAVLFRLAPGGPWKKAVLLVVNLLFFGTFFGSNWIACLPFVGFLLLGYIAMHRVPNRLTGWVLVGAIMVAFFWLKKYTLVPSSLLLSFPYVTIGLSYVFFRVLHLAIDAQQNSLPHRPGVISYLNYTLNFTSLMSGPIQRYDDYHVSEVSPAPLGLVSFGRSAERIIVGLFKVFVLSTALFAMQRRFIDAMPMEQTLLDRAGAECAVVALYPLFLYANFSGYTDFVIGVAAWFGITLPRNFNRPFQSENFITFWSRWHITLSMWLRTYVYQPLMMSMMARFPNRRLEGIQVVVALFVTFFLVGAWHGQTRAFLFFGVLQGLGVSVNRIYQLAMERRLGKKQYRILAANWFYRSFARGLTFTWFAFTLLWFWCDWAQIIGIFRSLGPSAILLGFLALFVLATIALAVWVAIFDLSTSITWSAEPVLRSRYFRTMWATALICVVGATIIVMNSPAPTIVYKNF